MRTPMRLITGAALFTVRHRAAALVRRTTLADVIDTAAAVTYALMGAALLALLGAAAARGQA